MVAMAERGRVEDAAGALAERSSEGTTSGAVHFLPIVSRVGSLIVRTG